MEGLLEHEVFFDGEMDEIGIGLQSKLFHHAVFMEGYRTLGHIQNDRRLFHRMSLGQHESTENVRPIWKVYSLQFS